MDMRGVTARDRLRSILVEKMQEEVVASSQAGTSDAGADDLVETKVKRKQHGGRNCSAPGCKVIYDEHSKQQGITFHYFPWSKPDLVKKWEDAMHRTAFKAAVHSCVCSNHFIPDSFDRTGFRVRLRAGAVPTIFEQPGHMLNPIQHRKPLAERNGHELRATKICKPTTSSAVEHSYSPVLEPSCIQHRKPLAERNSRELTAPMICKPTTSSAVEHSYSPVLEPFCKRLKKCNSAIGTNAVSVESEAKSNLTIPPFKLSVCNGHNYSLPSPRVLKRKLGTMESALARYKHKVRILTQKNRRLQLKVKSLQQLLGNLHQKDLISQQAADNIQSSFSLPTLQLIGRMLKGKSRQGVKFPDELKAFALTLQFYSARAYSYVREAFNFCLPHPRTLSSWYSCVNGNPGFHNEIFFAISEHIKNNDNIRMPCALMMDEIAIRKQLDFDRSADKFVGYVDMGVPVIDLAGLPIAKEALVFFLVSLTDRWKVPVAYFLIDGLHGKERANLVQLCIEKLYFAGVLVISLTFDGCSANFSMCRELGASFDINNMKPTFLHPVDPSKQVCLILDPCHMLKLMRNTLAEKRILIDSDQHEIKWQYIQDLQVLQSKEGVRAANRLSERHIQWSQQKMKVRLAAQTLSSSVADSLEFCQKDLCIPKFKDCTATVKFIRIIDRLFDVMNSRNPLAKGYKSPLFRHNESYWRPFLLEAIQYLKGLKLADGQPLCYSVRKTGAVGFIVSSVSIMHLFDYTVKAELHPLRYLLTYKLSQDHLELFFAVVRSRGGSNNNPSALHLRNTWKRLLTHHELKDVASGNCIPQDSSTLMAISCRMKKDELAANVDIETIINHRRYASIDFSDHADHSVQSTDMQEIPGHLSLSRFVENVVAYIAGFVVRTLLKKLSCMDCKLAMLKTDENSHYPNANLLMRKDRGGLVIPASDVVTVCKITEMHVRQNTGSNQKPLKGCGINGIIVSNVLAFLVGSSVFESLSDHDLCNEPLSNHRVNLMRNIANDYTLIRLFHQCKTVTRLVQGQSCRSVLSKTVIFKGQ